MFAQSLILTLASISQVSGYSLCNPINYRLKDTPVVDVPFKGTATIANAAGQPVTVGGTLTIIDGCSFSVKGLTFAGVPTAGIYGGIGSASATSVAVRLINNVITGPGPVSETYTFITSAGSFVSFTDFDQFRLFDPTTGILIGTVDIPGNGVVPTNSSTPNTATTRPAGNTTPPTGTGTTPPTSGSSSAATTPSASPTTNGAQALGFSVASFVAYFLL